MIRQISRLVNIASSSSNSYRLFKASFKVGRYWNPNR